MKWIFLPGMDGSGQFFVPFVKILPETVEPVAIGFPANQKLGYDELFQWLLPRLPQNEPFLVVAESFSGPLAVRLAAARPAGLIGAVISASFVRHPLPRFLHRLPLEWVFRFPLPWGVARFLLADRSAGPEIRSLFDRVIRYSPPEVLAHRARAALRVDESEALVRCELPLLFLQATSDRLIRGHAVELVKRLRPDVKVTRIAAPHFLLQLKPRECLDAIERFLKDIVDGKARR